MADVSYKELSLNGLWKNNPAIVQLLGLCPLLAVTATVVNALGLALATAMVLICSNVCVSLIRNIVSDAVRLPAFVMIIASAVTCIELLMQAYTYELYEILGIFLPLITTNCVILGRADGFASRNALGPAAYDGFIMGAGFAVVLVLLGAMRELVGTGALFANMDLLFGPIAADWKVTIADDYPNFLLAVLPPGAFIFTGLIIAGKNVVDIQIKRRRDAQKIKPVKGAKRVRVTGHIS
ncbi:MAG: electron transport complex subunit E [Pseudomonadota bacterium]